MKKHINKRHFPFLLILLFAIGINQTAMSQCTTISCSGTTENPGDYSSALGDGTRAFGMASFSTGLQTFANGHYSSAFGVQSVANGYNSFAAGMLSNAEAGNTFVLGDFLNATANSTLIFGSGVDANNKLTNNIPRSLMIGFESINPTFFIEGPETGYDRTGRIGIGNVTSPLTKLHIKADDNERAELFLEAHTWNSSAISSLFIGDQNHSVTASGEHGLVFSTGFNKSFIFNFGRVGIGLENPEEQLHVKGTVLTSGFKMPQQELRDGWVLTADQTGRAFWAPSQNLWYLTETNDVYRPFEAGNVGIGLNNPLSRLEVKGQLSIGYHVAAVDENNLIVEGNVGIGTSTPGEKLDVVGKIKTTKFQLLDGQINGNILMSDNEGNASWVDPSLIDDGDWSLLANNLYVDGGRYRNRYINTLTSTRSCWQH